MSVSGSNLDRATKELHRSVGAVDRKFWVALALFAFLAALVWFTMGEGTVLVFGNRVETRLIPLIVIGAMALRTVLARQAEKIRKNNQ